MIEYSRKASKDVDEIHKYSSANWSEHHADKYLAEMELKLNQLDKNMIIGHTKTFSEYTDNYIFFKSHIIIYKNTSRGILIRRILYNNMDIVSHLKEKQK